MITNITSYHTSKLLIIKVINTLPIHSNKKITYSHIARVAVEVASNSRYQVLAASTT